MINKVVTGQDPTQIRVRVKEDGENKVIDLSDTITAVIFKNGSAMSSVVVVDTSATGSDIANGRIICEWTRADSLTWLAGTATLWVTINDQDWYDDNLQVKEGKG